MPDCIDEKSNGLVARNYRESIYNDDRNNTCWRSDLHLSQWYQNKTLAIVDHFKWLYQHISHSIPITFPVFRIPIGKMPSRTNNRLTIPLEWMPNTNGLLSGENMEYTFQWLSKNEAHIFNRINISVVYITFSFCHIQSNAIHMREKHVEECKHFTEPNMPTHMCDICAYGCWRIISLFITIHVFSYSLSLSLDCLVRRLVFLSFIRTACKIYSEKNQTETYDSGVNNHISQIHTESARSLSVHEFSVLFAFSIKYFRSLECLFRIVPLLNCVRRIENSFRAAVYLCMVWWIRLCDIAITQQYTVVSLAYSIMHALGACLYWYRSDDNDNGTALLFNTQPTYTHMQIGKKQRPKENEPGIPFTSNSLCEICADFFVGFSVLLLHFASVRDAGSWLHVLIETNNSFFFSFRFCGKISIADVFFQLLN